MALHVGTLLAIVLYFRTELTAMTRALPGLFAADPGPHARLMRMIAVGTMPVVIVAIAFNDFIEQVLRTPAVAAGALAVGAMLMLAAERVGPPRRTEDTIGWWEAVLIGCAQAAALIPGMSRSGGTIAVGMLLGVRRDASARFTFLLAIPAMLAAAAKEGLEVASMQMPGNSTALLAVGVIVSAVMGYVTIKYFLRFLAGHTLDVFAVYRLALAAATVVWLLTR